MKCTPWVFWTSVAAHKTEGAAAMLRHIYRRRDPRNVGRAPEQFRTIQNLLKDIGAYLAAFLCKATAFVIGDVPWRDS
jgi:hypothetical protein